MKIKPTLVLLFLLIPYLIIYRSFFLPGHLVWGDAPFFYGENLKELFNKPFIWDFRNDNFGTTQNYVLWLNLPTFMYGLINYLFHFSNDILIRLIFYFPATILALVGSWLYIGVFTKNTFAKLLGSFLYGFNTYFLVVLDGGQLGVALAYGLFPLVIYIFDKYLKTQNLKNYFLLLITLTLISNIDLRVFILSIFFELLVLSFNIFNYKIFFWDLLKKLALVFIPVLILDFFWIVQIFSYQSLDLQKLLPISNLNLVNLTNSLSLFQPHFPLNEFGNIFPTPFYFGFIPAILLLGFFSQKNSQNNALKQSGVFLSFYLIFAFLAKGGSQPFGEFYIYLIEKLPFGFAFRDSSKFFIPLLLSTSVLLSFSVDKLETLISKKFYYYIVIFLIYGYLLLLVLPGITGNLTGVLAGGESDHGYNQIYRQISQTPGFFRTLWFPEKPALAFANWEKPAISANTLFKEIPFALQIQGEYDLFNFLHSSLLSDWLRLFGVKYVFFPPDLRQKTFSDQEQKDRITFLRFVDGVFQGKNLSWSAAFPGYEIAGPTQDRIFTQPKVAIVVGGGEVYQELKQKINFDLTKTGLIFLEDSLTEPRDILKLPAEAAILIYNSQNLNSDITMSFLQKDFLDLNFSQESEWGMYRPSDYLKWRYELLRHDIETLDLGYGRGILYSSINGERATLRVPIKESGDYYLALRHIEASNSGLLKVKFAGLEQTISANKNVSFNWDLLGPVNLNSGQQDITFENLGGFRAINVIALVSDKDLLSAQGLASNLAHRFLSYNLNSDADLKIVQKELSGSDSAKLTYRQNNPTDYSITLTKPTWVIFSDHFNKGWNITGTKVANSYPVYSMINAFWVDDKNQNLRLYFTPQSQIDKGLGVSIITGLLLIVFVTVIVVKKKLNIKL
ncbi:MAG: hypothetical protein Q7R49_04310 [Candidatus Daviesbacteria bacterium]|nr:hypothetical protein [Candidatus Daviesbacteria bacterium]